MKIHRKKMRKANILSIVKSSLVACTAFISLASHPAKAANELPPSLAEKVEKLKTDLSSRGYDVAQGEFHLFTINDCKYAIRSIGNCLGNNPTAPYVIPTVPLWPDEYVDKNMANLLGPVAENMGWTYRLSERDAIVILGLLPPAGRYFGVQSYIFSREGSANTADQIFQTLSDPFMKSVLFMTSPNPARPLVFSSLGNSINNVTIERKSGEAFGQQRYVVVTSSSTLNQELSEALLRAGVLDSREIFTEPVSPDLARMGLNASADDFMTLIRYALPNDEAAGELWRKKLPLVLLRVRSKDPAFVVQPYATPERDVRIAESELNLTGSLDNLVAAVKDKWSQPTAHESRFYSLLMTVDLVGEHCLQRPMNCLGDTGDADYQISETVEIDSGKVLAVAGTLGTVTGNAVYSSLSVNRIPELVGVANLTDIDLGGTTLGYSPLVANTEKLYLQYFARDCTKLSHCLQVTEQMVPRGQKLKLIQRNYVALSSARGPDPKMLENPRLIVLKGPNK